MRARAGRWAQYPVPVFTRWRSISWSPPFALSVSTLADDVAHAVETLSAKGGLHERDRQRVKTGTGY